MKALNGRGKTTECTFGDGTAILLASFVASFVRSGDELTVPANIALASAATEIYLRPADTARAKSDFFLAEVGYVTQPHQDKRNNWFVKADVRGRYLDVTAVHIGCDVVRDYFYVGDRHRKWDRQPSLYDLLRVEPNASPTELRVAFRVRDLELRTSGGAVQDLQSLERAFNILARPELRECYDELLADSDRAALFPYGGFGSLFVSGSRSRDGATFYASRIISFLPDRVEKTVHVPLRKCSFYDHVALYRDTRQKLEVLFDQSAIAVPWSATWNQWKHLLGAKVRVKGTFIQSGTYRHKKGEWELVTRRTALPSRMVVAIPADLLEQVDRTRQTYHRFGEFTDLLSQIRRRLETTPLEREELRLLCSGLGIPADFDVSLITWKPDYDPFYYKQLYGRARRVYLFRSEYIFDLERAVVVETPQLGHATYVFSKPTAMANFLALYRLSSRDDVLRNRANVAENLGFFCRLIHGSSPRNWLKELRARLGETVTPNSDTAQ